MKQADSTKSKVQAEALARWELAGRKGILAMGTGTGKTKVALDRAWKLLLKKGPENLRILLAVPTTKLRDENWPQEIADWNYYPLIEERGIWNAFCYASLATKPSGHYDLVILDEGHRSTEYNSQVFENITYNELMVLTATVPTDREKRKLLLSLAPIVFEYHIDQAVDDGLVADYDLVVIEVPPDNTNKYIPAGNKKKPFKQTEAANYKFKTSIIEPLQIKLREKEKELFIVEQLATDKDPMLDEILELDREVKKMQARLKPLIMQRAQLVYNMKSKTAAAKTILREIVTSTNRTLVFAGSIAQCETLCAPMVYHSKSDDKWLAMFKAEEIHFLGVVNALNEGHNIPNLDQALIVQASSNERDLVQRIGRVIRYRPGFKGKIYLLVSTGTVDEKWVASALSNINPDRITRTTLEAWLETQQGLSLSPVTTTSDRTQAT